MASLYGLFPRIRQTLPSVIALSLSLISLGVNAHSVSDRSADTHAGQFIQSMRPEMGLPLPESCCDQVAQAAEQPPAAPVNNPDAGKGTTVTAGDELDELLKQVGPGFDSANEKAQQKYDKARSENDKARSENDKARSRYDEALRVTAIIDSLSSRALEIFKIIVDGNINDDQLKSYIAEMDNIYLNILNININDDGDDSLFTLKCAKNTSLMNFQIVMALHPSLQFTRFAKDGLSNPNRELYLNHIKKGKHDEYHAQFCRKN